MVSRKLYAILKKGFKSLTLDYNGTTRRKRYSYLFLIIIPFLIFIGILYWNKTMSCDTIGTILSVLGIFTSLLFGVIFIAPDKLNDRIIRFSMTDNEAVKNYIIRFANFAKLFVSRLSFVILLCLCMIILLCTLLIIPSKYKFIILATNALSDVLFYFVVITLIVLLTDIYSLLNDDIDKILKHN